jgi:hypothetical protein
MPRQLITWACGPRKEFHYVSDHGGGGRGSLLGTTCLTMGFNLHIHSLFSFSFSLFFSFLFFSKISIMKGWMGMQMK